MGKTSAQGKEYRLEWPQLSQRRPVVSVYWGQWFVWERKQPRL